MPRGRKKIDTEIEKTAMEVSVIADAGDKSRKKAGRPAKVKTEAKPAAKRSAKKAAADAPKKKPGRPARKKLEEAIAAVESTEAPKKRRGRPAKNTPAEAQKKPSRAAKKAAVEKEEIIDRIIAADFTGQNGTGDPFGFTDEETKVLKAFVKALTKAMHE